MDKLSTTYDLYNDIQARTNGEIYIGIVGPVRTGKSTFIKRFMDLVVIPNIENVHEKERTTDELPQSAAGKTVMTTEPKFIPKEAVELTDGEDMHAKFRLIDCVGYMVKGASGVIEDGKERFVKTPWFEKEIPFTEAAEYGTSKVIKDHSTIGIVVTTDGSFGELPRENYLDAEEKVINELKSIGKPFIVIVNSIKPGADDAKKTAEYIASKYQVTAMPVNCEQMRSDDIYSILRTVLYEFPIQSIEFYLPKWIEMLDDDSDIKTELIGCSKGILNKITYMKDINKTNPSFDCKYVTKSRMEPVNMSNGIVRFNIDMDDQYYYQMLSDMTGEAIGGEYQLINTIKALSEKKNEYARFVNAIDSVKNKGYGVVMPDQCEITLSSPEVIKNGNKYGVKLKAESPSIHMIRVNIGTEIAPIVGSEPQATDLKNYIDECAKNGNVWDTNIFGKSVGQLVEDGIEGKIRMMNDDCQLKLQDTMQKVVNENSGGLICLII